MTWDWNRWKLGARTLALAALLAAAAAPAAAQNLLDNWQLDHDVSGWSVEPGVGFDGGLVWTALDPNSSPERGSVRVLSRADHSDFVWVHQCVPAQAGAQYRFGVQIRNLEDHEPRSEATYGLRFYPSTACDPASALATFDTRLVTALGVWVPGESGPVTAPPGTRAVALRLGVRRASAGENNALTDFSLPFVERVGAPPAPDEEAWFTDPQYPGFRFAVEITAGGSTRIGAWEPHCLPETVCVSGAVAGRSEVFLRIVGPKPNGYLWPTLFKASTARFDVWIEQLATGVVQHYVLPGAEPGSDELPGLFDREGFLP